MEYEKRNEEQLLGLVYEKLSEVSMDKWDFKNDEDIHIYTTKVGNLTVEVRTPYGRDSKGGNYAILTILDGTQEIYRTSGVSDFYQRLTEQHKKFRVVEESQKRCSPLEQLLNVLGKSQERKEE